MNITYRKLKTENYIGRCGKYYIFIRKREHGKWDGFNKYCKWYTVYITLNGEYVFSEGVLGSSLPTIKKAKDWVKKKLFT